MRALCPAAFPRQQLAPGHFPIPLRPSCNSRFELCHVNDRKATVGLDAGAGEEVAADWANEAMDGDWVDVGGSDGGAGRSGFGQGV